VISIEKVESEMRLMFDVDEPQLFRQPSKWFYSM
jgi:hypothetical protein